MACFLEKKNETSISIPEVKQTDKYTIYCIFVRIGEFCWMVNHRYSEFDELHEKLVSDHGLQKDTLPPKKVIGNRDPAFIEERRLGLETYLRNTVNFLQRTIPRELALFLDFHHYEILFLLQDLALKFFIEGDALLASSRNHTFTPLELHAISERIKQPCPPLEIIDKRLDFSHVLDFCCQLTSVSVRGDIDVVKTSNITPNNLTFELSAFKSAESLTFLGVCVDKIYNAATLRDTVVILSVHYSNLKKIVQMLLCDDVHKDMSNAGEGHVWKKIVEANFGYNLIESTDESVKLMPNIQILHLNNNKLSALSNLTSLPHLSHLNLSANCFERIDDFHTKVGNIISINLSENCITSLAGFSKLYSLESLDLSLNKIADITEIKHITRLPCLENLILTGNPVTTVLDYRVKVLEYFGSRSSEICLDNEKSTQKELDTVAVLQALRIVREGRTPTFGSDAPVFP